MGFEIALTTHHSKLITKSMSEFAIEAQQLRKEFGTKVAVANLTIQVRRGEVFGFLGPNGAGKTTSIKMLLGLIRANLWKCVKFTRSSRLA